MRRVVGVAFAVAFAASVSPALADSVETGVLQCRGVSQQYIIGSTTNMECVYRPNNGARPVPYLAVIRRGGLDIGFNQSTDLVWSVFSPASRPGPGDLTGSYLGASANATVGIGFGTNVLWGGSNSTVSLQPVSMQSQTGFGAVGGISQLSLRSVEPHRSYGHHHHRHHHRR